MLLEGAPKDFRGGNSRHTRNLRYLHETGNNHLTGPYLEDEFWDDLMRITGGQTSFHKCSESLGLFHIIEDLRPGLTPWNLS